ncbi:uncharacterized protein LOC144574867 isoform X1 [Carex rostrata]
MERKKHGVAGRNKSTSSSSSNSDSNSNSILEELFGRKETNCNYKPKVKSSSSSNSSAAGAGAGYFSTVFPHPNPDPYHLAGNDTSHSDLHWTLNRHRVDGKTNGNSSKNQLPSYSSYTKDGKTAYSTESAESSHFGSSVHYGARDFYATSPSKYAPPELPKTHTNDDNDNDSVATRGDWWQGSLYY